MATARSSYAAMPPKTNSKVAGVKRSKPSHAKKPSHGASAETTTRSAALSLPKPVVFWKPDDDEYGFLSLWYPTTFTDASDASIAYPSVAHYKTYQKALLFDPPSGAAILEATTPNEVRALGRQVPNFDDSVWAENKLRVVTEGCRLKFTRSPEAERLRGLLLATADRELIAASTTDRTLSIGFDPAKAETSDRKKWGKNLLGKALTTVRSEFLAEDAESSDSPESGEDETAASTA